MNYDSDELYEMADADPRIEEIKRLHDNGTYDESKARREMHKVLVDILGCLMVYEEKPE